MSQVYTTMAMTTTPLVTVVSSGMSSLSLISMAPSLIGLPATMGQCNVVLPPPLKLRCLGGIIGLASVSQQQPPSLMPLQAYANYAMGSSHVGFFFRVEPPTVLYIICLVPVLVSAFYSQVLYWMPYSPLGAQSLGFTPLQPFGVHPLQAYVQPSDGHWPTPEMHRVAAPSSTTLSMGAFCCSISCSPAIPSIWWGIQLWGLGRESPGPSSFPAWWKGVFFPGLVPSDDTVNSESVMSVKLGETGLVIGYEVDGFVAGSHIYSGFTGKVLSFTPFLLELGCEAYSFLDEAVVDFEQGLDSILLTISLETQELDTSMDDPDAITSSVFSGLLHLVSTLSDLSKPHPAPSIRSHKLWCQAKSLATKMSASKLICYFSSHPVAFGFWSSSPPDNITLTSANRKADQFPSYFQTGSSAAAHATLDTEQLISHLSIALVDTFSSVPNSEGGIIPASEVHELLLKVHNILDNAVSKWVGNSAHILAHVFNSVSRQCHEVWTSQFPFLHSLRDMIPTSEVCLYGDISWSLTQAQQHSSMGFVSVFSL